MPCVSVHHLRGRCRYDKGERNTHIASMAKLFASEHCHKVVSDAVQVRVLACRWCELWLLTDRLWPPRACVYTPDQIFGGYGYATGG